MDFKKYNNIFSIYFTVNPPYLLVQSIKDIKRLKGRLSFEMVLKVNRSLQQKRSIENSEETKSQVKKIYICIYIYFIYIDIINNNLLENKLLAFKLPILQKL